MVSDSWKREEMLVVFDKKKGIERKQRSRKGGGEALFCPLINDSSLVQV